MAACVLEYLGLVWEEYREYLLKFGFYPQRREEPESTKNIGFKLLKILDFTLDLFPLNINFFCKIDFFLFDI